MIELTFLFLSNYKKNISQEHSPLLLVTQCKLIFYSILLLSISCRTSKEETIGNTIVTTWQGDKKSAISLTYDDGTIHQFTVARPIMNKLGFPATFFIITGKIKGSAQGKFIGRSADKIIKETASIKTDSSNFFERASLIGFTGVPKIVDYHTQAGVLFESGKIEEAYAKIDTGFEKVRGAKIKSINETIYHNNSKDTTTWEDFKAYAAEGHEIASHTVTHPRLSVLNEVNLLYELQQSKADIIKYVGEQYTFSAECPYGTENERVMEYAHKIYPALRNRMPASYLDELNRSSKRQPYPSNKEIIQWQRGPLRSINMTTMKSWVDTCIVHDNIWLVLVFHGVDSIGWEPRTGAELQEYFSYIKSKESDVWVATFGDVTKYMRERKSAIIKTSVQQDSIKVNVTSELDPKVYNIAITLKTYIPSSWKEIKLYKNEKGRMPSDLKIQKDKSGSYVLYDVMPGEGEIVLSIGD
ncbi:MAG: polysaccharide deacetylase family protein [Saprospiraceae bacterium]